jgi:antitoxin component of RelBE/YafQ-DinJ toxin-antitoxin module
MARKEVLVIRVLEDEKKRLEAEASRRGVSMSEVIRDYIKRLPKPIVSGSSLLSDDSAI